MEPRYFSRRQTLGLGLGLVAGLAADTLYAEDNLDADVRRGVQIYREILKQVNDPDVAVTLSGVGMRPKGSVPNVLEIYSYVAKTPLSPELAAGLTDTIILTDNLQALDNYVNFHDANPSTDANLIDFLARGSAITGKSMDEVKAMYQSASAITENQTDRYFLVLSALAGDEPMDETIRDYNGVKRQLKHIPANQAAKVRFASRVSRASVGDLEKWYDYFRRELCNDSDENGITTLTFSTGIDFKTRKGAQMGPASFYRDKYASYINEIGSGTEGRSAAVKIAESLAMYTILKQHPLNIELMLSHVAASYINSRGE